MTSPESSFVIGWALGRLFFLPSECLRGKIWGRSPHGPQRCPVLGQHRAGTRRGAAGAAWFLMFYSRQFHSNGFPLLSCKRRGSEGRESSQLTARDVDGERGQGGGTGQALGHPEDSPGAPRSRVPMCGSPGEGSLELGAVGSGQPRPLPRRAAGLSGSANGNECP